MHAEECWIFISTHQLMCQSNVSLRGIAIFAGTTANP